MKYKVKFLEIAKADKENIKEMPYMYPEYKYYPNYRRIVIGNYLIFYKINDEEKTVEIHRILPGMWDLARYFENINNEM
jgi:mRNA-degrading endonuclease RelE of RelBE toxin-antitoxin system